MAKPKFELTSDLVKIEPEPEALPQSFVNSASEKRVETPIMHEQSMPLKVETIAHSFVNQTTVGSPTLFSQSVEIHPQEPLKPKEERQSMSLFISKNLKKQFHLHCVQNGLSMTDAIEIAIQNYLDAN